jgi:hypothetical protein
VFRIGRAACPRKARSFREGSAVEKAPALRFCWPRDLFQQARVDERPHRFAARLVAEVQDRVLGIPPVDTLVFPYEWPQPVLGMKAVRSEERSPPRRPLPIPTGPTWLMRNCRAEQHSGRMQADRLDESGCPLLRNVVRRLQRDREVEHTIQPKRLPEVAADELARRDSQRLRLDVRAVDADDVGNAKVLENLQPRPGAASHIDDAGRAQTLDHARDDDAGRPLGTATLPTEVSRVEVRRGFAQSGQSANSTFLFRRMERAAPSTDGVQRL